MTNILIVSMYSEEWDYKYQHKLYKNTIGKYAKLIIKRYYDIKGIKTALKGKIDGIIVTGSDFFILEKKSPKIPGIIFKYNIPILAICYGLQYLAIKDGKRSNINSFKTGTKNYFKKITIKAPFKVKKLEYKYFHQDYLVGISKKYKIIKMMGKKIIIAYHKTKNILGIQFHPEYNTKTGKEFFRKWLQHIKRVL